MNSPKHPITLNQCFSLLEDNDLTQAQQCIEAHLQQKQLLPACEFILKGLKAALAQDAQTAFANFGRAAGKSKKDAALSCYLARAYALLGQNDQALLHAKRAVQIDDTIAPAWCLLARLSRQNNDTYHYISCVLKSIEHDIDNLLYWQNLYELAQRRVSLPVLFVRKLLIEALQRGNAELMAVRALLLPILKTSNKVALLNRLHEAGQLDEKIANGEAIPHLDDELLLAALNNMIISNLAYEKLFTALRKAFLKNIAQQNLPETNIDTAINFVASLAVFSVSTEFVLYCSPKELTWLEQCKQRLAENEDNPQQRSLLLAIIACYELLLEVEGAQTIAQQLAPVSSSAALRNMINLHIESRLIEKSYLDKVESFSAIQDDVSRSVQQQYEENPYPRWLKLDNLKFPAFDKFITRILPHLGTDQAPSLQASESQPVEVLIAGCGTGRQALSAARQYRNASVLAVDLSRASLAYALMKAEAYQQKNVTFRQGDLLALPDLNRKFDIIESSGVIHHMDDPQAGLAAIDQCLKPGGWLKLALYSELARKEVNLARDEIARKNYPATDEGIREFRHRIMANPEDPMHALCTTFFDFYTLSECRDLLFHVQEHQFTCSKIQQLIAPFDLEFMGFDTSGLELTGKQPEISNWQSLEQWQSFEEANPETFVSMYYFWLRKPL